MIFTSFRCDILFKLTLHQMLEMSSGIFLDYMNQSRWQNQFSAILTDLDVAVGRIYRYRAIIVTIPLLTISPSDSRLEPLKRHPSDVCRHTDLQPSVPSRTTVSSFLLYQSYPSSLSRRPLPLESIDHHQV